MNEPRIIVMKRERVEIDCTNCDRYTCEKIYVAKHGTLVFKNVPKDANFVLVVTELLTNYGEIKIVREGQDEASLAPIPKENIHVTHA